MTKPMQRNRWWYVSLCLWVIGAGLLWRSHLLALPKFAEKYGGDALWALLVYLGFGLIFPRRSILQLFALALGFAWVIEFSQLYHAPWVDLLRATRLGRLILGSTFNPPDLLAYAVGNVLGAAGELFWASRAAATVGRGAGR